MAENSELAIQPGHEPLRTRDVLARVNLRDFGNMLWGELELVGGSLKQALQSRSPATIPAVFVALLRLALLVGVTLVLGGAILVVTLARAALRLLRVSPAA